MWSGQSTDAQQQQNPDSDVNIASDVFGHTAYLDGLASKVNINSALAEMQTELAAIPTTEKVAMVQVQRLKPQLLDDEHVLQFLWAENFSAPVSWSRSRCIVFYQHDPSHTSRTATGRRPKACPILERPIQDFRPRQVLPSHDVEGCAER